MILIDSRFVFFILVFVYLFSRHFIRKSKENLSILFRRQQCYSSNNRSISGNCQLYVSVGRVRVTGIDTFSSFTVSRWSFVAYQMDVQFVLILTQLSFVVLRIHDVFQKSKSAFIDVVISQRTFVAETRNEHWLSRHADEGSVVCYRNSHAIANQFEFSFSIDTESYLQ